MVAFDLEISADHNLLDEHFWNKIMEDIEQMCTQVLVAGHLVEPSVPEGILMAVAHVP